MCASGTVKLCSGIIYSELSSQLGSLRTRANTITRCNQKRINAVEAAVDRQHRAADVSVTRCVKLFAAKCCQHSTDISGTAAYIYIVYITDLSPWKSLNK
jgi:hypothetical protein